MINSTRQLMHGSTRTVSIAGHAGGAGVCGSAAQFWSQHREASLNWLALGLLLAAWNASDNDAKALVARRPQAFRGYSHVSVRAIALHPEGLRAAPMKIFTKVTKG